MSCPTRASSRSRASASSASACSSGWTPSCACADRFRDAGVQDVNGYRNAPGTPPLPRILLIVDEFQEFFAEEDKLAQEAASWLDRLVRQGRAFGIHIILGSQSLGGAFTLARSTLGQMAVRIALQCSENDAHLILSENNIAPRMLSRPGEAIYNDANGAARGQPLLPGRLALRRAPRGPPERAARTVANTEAGPFAHARSSSKETPRPIWLATLFSGAASRRHLARITAFGPGLGGRGDLDQGPDSALFRRQGGNNLLIVGQNEEAALGVSIAVLISLAAQFPAGRLRNGSPGCPFLRARRHARRSARTPGLLASAAAALPHGAVVGGWRELASDLARGGGRASSAARSPRPTAPRSSCSSTTCRGSATSAAARTTSASRARTTKKPLLPTTSTRSCAKDRSWAST